MDVADAVFLNLGGVFSTYLLLGIMTLMLFLDVESLTESVGAALDASLLSDNFFGDPTAVEPCDNVVVALVELFVCGAVFALLLTGKVFVCRVLLAVVCGFTVAFSLLVFPGAGFFAVWTMLVLLKLCVVFLDLGGDKLLLLPE